jgi:GT2 family glycosyltransferase/SAM-dependent methyltransferase
MSEQERRKWDAYYDSLPLNEEDESTRQFNVEFVERVSALLPPGSKTLEAGCGAGWQSLALARSGRFDVSLLDFSPKALDYSRRVFAREGLTATALQGDIRASGSAEYDLVFNAGVLEHYTFEEQSALLRAMASRSRRYVLVLVPNALCYWYWLWRIQKMAAGDWPFGNEVPLADLGAVFQSAGLQFCGQVFLGRSWSEAFIRGLPGMDPELSWRIVEIHRQEVVPLAQRSYLVAALACVSAGEPQPPGWTFPTPEGMEFAEQRAMTADSVALHLGGGAQLKAERQQWEATLAAEREKWESALELERSRTRSAQGAARQKLESLLAAEMARSESALLAELDRLESGRTGELERLESLRRRVWEGLREFRAQFEKQLGAYKSQRAWRVMLAIRKAYTLIARRRIRGLLPLFSLQEYELSFPDVLDYVPQELDAPAASVFLPPNADRRYDVVVLPIFDFEFRFQRPQQIAAQFARAGHRVFWISPSRLLPVSSPTRYETFAIRENLWEVRLPVEPFDLYRGELEPFQITALLDGLSRLYRDLDITASCTLLQFPFWRQIGLGLRERFGAKVVYDCMDDWQNWPVEPLPGAFSLSEERELVRESDVLVVTSRELRDRHAADRVASQLIPNAADFEFFHDAPASAAESGLPHPVIGYYGAIADWFDLELMTQVARSRPQYSFVLIGQVHMLDVSALEALPNVRLLGEKHYRELPAHLREFDVCTLPFRMNRLTKAVDPVKMYEYFSQGKPVVSAPLPELAPLAELLYFAQGPEEFARQIDAALVERDGSLAKKRIAFAAENTWRRRYEVLDSAICACFPLVSILIVTYNTREYLGPCLESIRRNTSYPAYEVIVVDNCSTDGSAEDLDRYAADPRVRVQCLQKNLGFAGGNNHAAGMAKGDYLVLLNPDTVVTAGWLERLLRPLEKDPRVGMAAPVSNFSGNETKVNTHYRSLRQMESFAAEQAKFRCGKTFDIDVVPLFCALLRRRTWEEAGGLDESFQVGTFEDDDFSLRLRNIGYRIVTAEDCFIHHFGNGSFGKLQSEEVYRIFELNQKRFESKWNTTWRGHKTRPGVRPVSTANRIPISEFFRDDGEP